MKEKGVMKRRWSVYALFVSVSLFPGTAHAIDCSGLPTQFTGNEFPKGNFFSNFDNSCYLIPFASGSGSQAGDLNSLYYKIYYKVDPRYQLIILGDFPNTRYFSITVYDAHGAPAQFILDANIVPLTSGFINPYQPGVAFLNGQQYAVPVDFGGTPGTLETGCMMNGVNVDVNAMDATQRHQGMDWNSDPNVFRANPNFGLHIVDTPQHTNPNTAGALIIRNYLDITPKSYQTTPHIIVRDVASGCAYPAAYAMNTLQILASNGTTGNAWLDGAQASLHKQYEYVWLSQLCYAANPQNSLAWERKAEYEQGAIPDGSYVTVNIPAGLPASLAGEGRVIRFRFRIPSTPPTPCTNGCSRSGSEELRYMSLSFQNPNGITLASLADQAFTQDPNGYVTLIVGTGASIPSWVTAADGYTFLDLTALSGYQQLQSLNFRNILPSGTFNCSGEAVPYHTDEYTPAGGQMGEYLPVADFPNSANLPQVAVPLVQPDNCGVFPNGPAAAAPACGVGTPPPVAISAVTTQCATQGCNQVVAQPQPPMIVVGGGFGAFPNGLPYTGNSNYLEITDTTQNWSAGYAGDLCTVAISGWAGDMIELVPNVNQSGVCPLAAGDQLTVTVWNPQSMVNATFTVTVASN
jgi:hypothetical protein